MRAMLSIVVVAGLACFSAAYCTSYTCTSSCYNCTKCSTTRCRRSLLDELMQFHGVNKESDIFSRKDELSHGANTDDGLRVTGHEQNQHRGHGVKKESELFARKDVEEPSHRRLFNCPCQSSGDPLRDSQSKYCCSSDGSTCGLGLDRGFVGITSSGALATDDTGLDGEGTECAGRCDLGFPCQNSPSLPLQCCSFEGFCGSGPDYCTIQYSACNDQALAPAFCGGGARGSGRCKSAAHCCSQYGWCDVVGSTDHCATGGSGQVWKYGALVTEYYGPSPTYCGADVNGLGVIGNGHCLGDPAYGVRDGLMCCSQNGYCGNAGCDKYGYPFCATLPASTCPMCKNGGTWNSSNNSCNCPSGFTGPSCETPATATTAAPTPLPTTAVPGGDCFFVIAKASSAYINLAEIHLKDTYSGVSISPTYKALSSTLTGSDETIDKCFDNNEDTICHTDHYDLNPFVKVYWACSSHLAAGVAVTIVNRKDCCQDRLTGATLTVYNADRSPFGSAYALTTAAYQTISVGGAVPVGDCFFVISKTNSAYINLAEIHIKDASGVSISPTYKALTSTLTGSDETIDKCFDNNEDTICHTDHPDLYPKVIVYFACGSSVSAGTSVTIVNRKDCCQDRSTGATVPAYNSNGFQSGTSLVLSAAAYQTVDLVSCGTLGYSCGVNGHCVSGGCACITGFNWSGTANACV